MTDDAELFFLKARESLARAESEFVNGRYNNRAGRCYYACFQAAISALIRAGLSPSTRQWHHDYVQAQFVGQLVNRRKRYPAAVRDILYRNLELRHAADYRSVPISQRQAERALQRTHRFLAAILEGDE